MKRELWIECYGLNLKRPPRAYVYEFWSPACAVFKAEEPLGVGAWLAEVKSLDPLETLPTPGVGWGLCCLYAIMNCSTHVLCCGRQVSLTL